MIDKTAALQNPEEIIKSPVTAEFPGFRPEDSYLESELESSIITHIRDFLMEMGRGFSFVARQQHIVADSQDYYIDLVFYNVELKCYVLIDLKTGMVTPQDAGQIDMYVRMYDDLNAKMVIIQQQKFFYVQKQTRISLDIQYYVTTTGCLCQSI